MIEIEKWALAAMLALFYSVICWFLFRRRGAATITSDIVVAYASQSGRAHLLATKTAEAFTGAASLCALNQLSAEDVCGIRTLYVVASTYGEGEPPDNGAAFSSVVQQLQPNALSALEFAILGLGDSHYPEFCAFAKSLYGTLHARGATPLCTLLEMDAANPRLEQQVLTQWQRQLQAGDGVFSFKAADQLVHPTRQRAAICERRLLNPGSPGAPMYFLSLSVNQGAVSYQAGDIIEIFPKNNASSYESILAQLEIGGESLTDTQGGKRTATEIAATRDLYRVSLPSLNNKTDNLKWLNNLPELAPRQYSIASAGNNKSLEIVVRQHIADNGTLGVASGFLTEHTSLGDELEFCIKQNIEFHSPDADKPLILIGNGSGIAGLRAHLKHRACSGGAPCWLLYGERDPQADRPFAGELTEWLACGVLEQLDCVFSRDPTHPEYVQDRMRANADLLEHWLQRDACILVCGSRLGMGEGVHSVLEDILGLKTVARMQAEGRYRRDVY
ncbi:sulfite reductase flavoprotein subunit alpha [Gilvimarinus sp. SDUM040013]|uniref:NADPH--hemoprotein reductase n=1 Tax=Gilvimarinus gilvus TaxID=3058038 RepID=A0ABU4RXA7_9GAMM|nr:sulfite reductase flavoprotein subunit alpha [Gilvimarinus sp. SDUM040013]MDO3385666.1 sulfite reductase flavoprotein subunit alpha [Gilvimarinus sp. SDUM040013]MDX6849304.1 sulfite reductase flavoprotein subunit alpha [Gilvimarinus sp. SDUM040013]